jgi:LEA14-like dessication related protein
MDKKVLLGVAVGLGLFEYRRFVSLSDNLSADVTNVKLEFKEAQLVINFQLAATNNSSKSIDVENVKGKMYIGDIFIGSYSSNQKTTIKPNTISYLPFTSSINTFEVLNNIKGKTFDSKVMSFITNAKVRFNVLGLITFPLYVKNETKVDSSVEINNFLSLIDKLKNLVIYN